MFRQILLFIFLFLNFWNPSQSIDCTQNKNSNACSSTSGCVWDTTLGSCVCSSNVAMDIIFAMDSSGSIGNSSWYQETSFVASVISSQLSSDSRVGIIRFATGSTVMMNFSTSATMTKSQIASFVYNMAYTAGYTDTVLAVNQSITMFEKQSTSSRSKVLVIVTDGNPNCASSPCSNNVCQFSSTLVTEDISTLILGVGSSWTPAKIDCLVTSSDDIKTVSNFSAAAFSTALPSITDITCPVTYQLIVTEAKVRVDTTSSTSGAFIEIYNSGTNVTIGNIGLKGLVVGNLSSSGNTTLKQGQYLVLYNGSDTHTPRCTNCSCPLSSNKCTDAIYLACGTTVKSCVFRAMTNTNFNVTLYDITDNSIIDTIKYDSAWPSIYNGYTYELTGTGYDNSLGSNWKMSCNGDGTPGSSPISDCAASCSDSSGICTSSGDSNATCNSATGTCTCSVGYYESGLLCVQVPPPSNCIIELSNAGSVKVATFTWDKANTDIAHQYQINYIKKDGSNGISIVYSRTDDIYDLNPSYFTVGAIGGTVQTYISSLSSNSVYRSNTINCTVAQTQAPTPAPTNTPTSAPTWATPYVYIGGDICATDRCGCAGYSVSCPITTNQSKLFTAESTTVQYVTIKKFPADFPWNINITWTITPLGDYSRRRLQSDINDTNTSIISTANSYILPLNGTVAQNSTEARVGFIIYDISSLNSVAEQEYLFTLEKCEVTDNTGIKSYGCDLVYPKQLTMLVQGAQNNNEQNINVSNKEVPSWVWILVSILAVVLFLLGLFAWRYWKKNKKTSAQLQDTKEQYIEAVREIEDGFGGDLDKGDVTYNPMATGVPGKTHAPNTFANVDGTNQDINNQRADVAVEKFAHRQELGQIKQGRK